MTETLVQTKPAPATASDDAQKSLLRFLTCGSVDDGKSTLIGRLLYDSKLIFEDQLAALERDSKKSRHRGRGPRPGAAGGRAGGRAAAGHHHRCGLPLLHHQANRSLHRRRHARPRAVHPQHGHRRLQRRPGGDPDRRAQGRADPDPPPQLHLLPAGREHLVLAVNKIDLADYSQAVFDRIVGDYLDFAKTLGFESITSRSRCRPATATTSTPGRTSCPGIWGKTLIEHLETIDVESSEAAKPFRFPVQWVNRPNLDFRGFSGTLASGVVQARRQGGGGRLGPRERRRRAASSPMTATWPRPAPATP